MTDHSTFPDPTYRQTVLKPLFEGVKTHYAQHMDAINRAHLVMLAETDILSREDAGQIAQALVAIGADVDVQTLDYTGEHEDYFFLVEAELKRRLGDLGGALHTARSRNDMDHTMFKLALMDHVATIKRCGLALMEALRTTAQKGIATPIVAYTHGQPAQPSTLAHYLGAVMETVISDFERLDRTLERIEECPMGAAAITTSGFPIDRARMAELLGFRAPCVNAYGCIARVDYITGVYSALKLICLHLGRVVQDLQVWSSFEVGQLYVPNAFVQVSSIMPQKRNPVPIEHMRHLASVTCGTCDTIVNTMHNTPFTDMNDSEGEVQQAGYAAFRSAERMLSLFAAMIGDVRINGDRVQRNADAACVTITELADTLVRDEGLTFRTAHEVAAETAKAVIADAKPLSAGYDAFANAFRSVTGRASALKPDAYAEAVSIEGFIARRDRIGGPAEPAMRRALDYYADAQRDIQTAFDMTQDRRTKADQMRADAFAKLLEL